MATKKNHGVGTSGSDMTKNAGPPAQNPAEKTEASIVTGDQGLSPANFASLTQDDVNRLQAPLIERLNIQMVQDKLNQGAFAEKLGITASYVTSIFNGFRWVPKSDRKVIDALATYMGVPVIQIYIWAGFFSPHDMVSRDNLANRVNALHEQMITDPMVRHIAPQKAEWMNWDLETKLRFVMLYEVASRTALLDHAQMELADSTLKKVRWVLTDADPKK